MVDKQCNVYRAEQDFDYSGETIRKIRYIDAILLNVSLQLSEPSVTFEVKNPLSGEERTKWAYYFRDLRERIENCFDLGKKANLTVYRKRRFMKDGGWDYIDIIVDITYDY